MLMAVLDQAGSPNGSQLWMTVFPQLFAIIHSTLCTRFWNDFWVREKLLKHWFTGANKLLVRLNYCDACQGSIRFQVVWVHIMETGDDLAGFCVGSLHIAITRVKPFDLLNWVWGPFWVFPTHASHYRRLSTQGVRESTLISWRGKLY